VLLVNDVKLALVEIRDRLSAVRVDFLFVALDVNGRCCSSFTIGPLMDEVSDITTPAASKPSDPNKNPITAANIIERRSLDTSDQKSKRNRRPILRLA
jgi:hypothetical protein